MALAGVSDFNFWNYNHNGTDVEILSGLLAELDSQAGCQARRPSYPACPGAPMVPCPSAVQFSRGFVLSGMDGVGSDGQQRVYRLTTADGTPSSHRQGSASGSVVYSIPSMGTKQPETCMVTFDSASVTGADDGPGVWVHQPQSAPLVSVECA